MRKVKNVIFSRKSEEIYCELVKNSKRKSSLMILRAINKKIKILYEYPNYGDKIQKKIRSKSYEYNNLFRLELPQFWRLIYTLKIINDYEMEILVIDIVNHKQYNKIFGYN